MVSVEKDQESDAPSPPTGMAIEVETENHTLEAQIAEQQHAQVGGKQAYRARLLPTPLFSLLSTDPAIQLAMASEVAELCQRLQPVATALEGLGEEAGGEKDVLCWLRRWRNLCSR